MTVIVGSLMLRSADTISAADLLLYQTANAAYLAPFVPARPKEFFTLDFQAEDFLAQKSCRFYISPAGSGQIIGFVALNGIIRGAFLSAYLSYQLDDAHRGRGYMTKAVQAAVTYAFDTLKLHRIEANIMPKNAASIAVVTKCGFTLEGSSPQYLKINGVWETHNHYVLLNQNV